MPFTRLDDRAVIAVSGADARPFLHNLLTQNVETLGPGDLRYAALLTPQGRLLHDLFLLESEHGVLLDVAASARDDLIRRLTLYRLRARVTIEPTDHAVFAQWPIDSPPEGEGDHAKHGGGGSTPAVGGAAPSTTPSAWPPSPSGGGSGAHGGSWSPDPRTPLLGERLIAAVAPSEPTATPDAYDTHRVALGVPDVARDGLSDRAYPLEADLDLLNGIDFRKGCFIGQETTSRMHRRGVVKTRLLPLAVAGAAAGAEVLAGALRAGEVTYARADRALALLRLDRIAGVQLTVAGRPARVETPPWFPERPATAAVVAAV